MAEREGFEPPGPCGPAVFKTAAIDHSATSPDAADNGWRMGGIVEFSSRDAGACVDGGSNIFLHRGMAAPSSQPSSSRADDGDASHESRGRENAVGAVAEIQGLYGPFAFPERLLQKLWLRGEFARDGARTTDGRRVKILFPGKWNLLGGPDFAAAKFQFDDEPPITGDVELHLRAEDWAAHGHARDRAYDDVKLHVVLFPPDTKRVARDARGEAIPTLCLLPLLWHDLEEYAADEAMEKLADRPAVRLVEELSRLPSAEVMTLLRREARKRWDQKVYFARLRVKRLGWREACHQTALEILGYRFNRAPMLRIATRVPLAKWAAGAVNVDELFASEAGAWSLPGVRPANHPRARLTQYATWTRERGDWPERLVKIADGLAAISVDQPTREARKAGEFPALRERIAVDICGEAVGGARLANLVCDGFWPLLAAEGRGGDHFGRWYHWYAGDLPDALTKGLRELTICDGRAQPMSHGLGQGLLGWMLSRETEGRGA